MTKRNINEEINQKFHPGVFIADIIDEMEITQLEFAKRMDVSEKVLSELINGKVRLTVEYAVKLGKMFGSDPQGWINIQNSYDHYKLELEDKKEVENI